jgi:hypothetical protein
MEVEFLRSRTGSWVPVVQDTLLHSTINPEAEAKNFIDSQWVNLKNAKSVIIFGLGGGFHINELLTRQAFEIVVIENSRELTRQLQEKSPKLFESIDVLSGLACDMVFKEPEIIKACSTHFTLLQHPASFRRAQFYYSSILKALNQRTVTGLRELTKGNEKLNRFLSSLDINGDQLLTLPMIEEAMHRRGTNFEPEGFIWMAIRELIV